MKSPIQQEIIDGLFYWDSIGANWFRLIERANLNVVSHIRREFSLTELWKVTLYVAGDFPQISMIKPASTEAEARMLAETWCAETRLGGTNASK